MILLVLYTLLFPGYCLLPERIPRLLRFPCILFASVTVTSLVALASALAGVFSLPLVAALEFPLILILFTRRRLPSPEISRHTVPLVLFFFLAVFTWLTIGEPFRADGDAGVYTIAARRLQETGALRWNLDDFLMEGIPRELILRETEYAYPWTEIAPGFIVSEGRVTPQFFPLYYVWGGVMTSALGERGMMGVNLLGGLLFLLAFHVLCRVHFRRPFPFLALLTVTVNPVFLLYVKFPTAEIFLTGLLAGWLLWTLLYFWRPSRKTAFFSGLLLLLAVMTKFFAWAAVGVLLLYALFAGLRRLQGVFLTLVCVIPGVLVCFYLAYPHLMNHLFQVRSLESVLLLTFALTVILLTRLFWRNLRAWLPAGGALLILLVLAWMTFGRPGAIETGSENNFLEFARLNGRGLTFLASFGLVWFVMIKRKSRQLFLPFLFCLISFYVLWGSGENPLYPFAARRFLPLTVPLTVFFFTFFLTRFRRMGNTFLLIVYVICVIPPVYAQRMAVGMRTDVGFMENVRTLKAMTGEEVPVFALPDTWAYAPHLLMTGHPAFCLAPTKGETLLRFDRYRRIHKSVRVLTFENLPLEVAARLSCSGMRIRPVRTPPLLEVESCGDTLKIFLLSRERQHVKHVLDVGGNDPLQTAGCYAQERTHGTTYRWTGDRSYFLLKRGGEARFRWSKGGNPEATLPVRVWCEGEMLADLFLTTDRWRYSPWFAVPEGEQRVILEIRTHPFQPGMIDGGNDYRSLGVMVDRVETRD